MLSSFRPEKWNCHFMARALIDKRVKLLKDLLQSLMTKADLTSVPQEIV